MVRVAVEVHGWHALERCGLLLVVQLVSRRRKRTCSTSREEFLQLGAQRRRTQSPARRARSRAAPGLVRLRAPGGAQDMALYIAAAKAARMRDLHCRPTRRHGGGHKHRALALWDHSRDWDPGDS